MSDIQKIEVRIVTGNRRNAGTDQQVFLVVGQHEFELDSSANDFERGSDRTYTLGEGANVSHASANGLRKLTLSDLEAGPVKLRVGVAAPAQPAPTTEPGHGALGDAVTRAANASGRAGAAINSALNQGARSAHQFLAAADWDVEDVTVTVHPNSGTPIVYQALQGDEHAWIGSAGHAELPLTRSDT